MDASLLLNPAANMLELALLVQLLLAMGKNAGTLLQLLPLLLVWRKNAVMMLSLTLTQRVLPVLPDVSPMELAA